MDAGRVTEVDELDPVAILAEMGMPAPGRVERVRGGADAATWRVERRFSLG